MRNDPVCCELLEERFLSSGFRRDMLNDKLATTGFSVDAPYTDILHWVACIATERHWLDDSYCRMRIVYKLPANRLDTADVRAIEYYLKAFYRKVTLDEATFLYARTVEFTVELAPMDSAWIKQVFSAPEKGK